MTFNIGDLSEHIKHIKRVAPIHPAMHYNGPEAVERIVQWVLVNGGSAGLILTPWAEDTREGFIQVNSRDGRSIQVYPGEWVYLDTFNHQFNRLPDHAKNNEYEEVKS